MIRAVVAMLSRLRSPIAYPLLMLSGRRTSTFVRRAMRLRRVASSMVKGRLVPPLPVRLQIETTDTCNLRCVHCTREVLDGMNTLSMDMETFTSIVDEIEPFYATMNGLGEPLIDKTIFRKLQLLHARGALTSMPTNGTYIRRHKREQLAANLPHILQLSIDGATKGTFEAIRKLANFEQTIENYRAICTLKAEGEARAGTVIRILCALQRANMNEFCEMYALYKSLPGVDSFSLVPVFDYDAEGDAFAALVPSPAEVKQLHIRLDEAIEQARTEDQRTFYANWRSVSGQWLAGSSTNRIDPETNTAPCAVPWYSTYIDAKGRVYPCCYLTNTPHVMGTVGADGTFGDIWRGENYQQFRASLMNGRPRLEGCRTCPKNQHKLLKSIERLGPLITLGGTG